MGNNNSRQMTYQQYYDVLQGKTVGNQARQENIPSPEMIDMSKLDPYMVLGVPKNFEWEQLKAAYRNAASLVHPDKGGNRHLFNIVTECFRYLANEYKARDADKPHYMLKQQSQDYMRQHQVYNDGNSGGLASTRNGAGAGGGAGAGSGRDRVNPPPTMDGMFLSKFNKAFEEHRLEDEEVQHGYGDMMEQSSKNRDDISVPKLMKKFDQGRFNKVFDKVVPVTKEVVIYKDPEPLQLSKNLQYTEIGGSKPNDYSSSMESSIQYTDYMKAHTTSRLVDPRAVGDRQEFKSVEQYERARNKTTEKPLTMEELRRKKEKEEQEKQAEQARLLRVKERDRIAEDHYERMNRLLLG